MLRKILATSATLVLLGASVSALAANPCDNLNGTWVSTNGQAHATGSYSDSTGQVRGRLTIPQGSAPFAGTCHADSSNPAQGDLNITLNGQLSGTGTVNGNHLVLSNPQIGSISFNKA